MNKIYSLIIVLTLISKLAISQNIVNEGIFKFVETKTKRNNDGKEIIRVSQHAIEFSNSFLKTINQIKENVFITTLSDLEKKNTKSYATNLERYYLLEENYNPLFFELGLYNDTKPEIELLNDTLTLKNYSCKKAIYKYQIDGNTESIEIWYSPEFKLNTNRIINIFNDLGGIPVKFKFVQKNRITIGGKNNITNCEFILDTFYQTKNYKVNTIENLEKYEEINEEEKVSKLMEIVNGRVKNNKTPKGVGITQKILTTNGTELTLTKYNPFIIGKPLQNFNAINLDGVKKSLSSYEGMTMVINFWFNKCAPCVKEMPLLNSIVKKNKEKNISFVSVTYNSKKEVEDFLLTKEFDFEKIINAQTLIDLYGVSSYPSTIIIDKNKIIRFIKIGAFENEEELQVEIDRVSK